MDNWSENEKQEIFSSQEWFYYFIGAIIGYCNIGYCKHLFLELNIQYINWYLSISANRVFNFNVILVKF